MDSLPKDPWGISDIYFTKGLRSDTILYPIYRLQDGTEKWVRSFDNDSVTYPSHRLMPDSIGLHSFQGSRIGVFNNLKYKKIWFFFVKESTLLNNTWEEIYRGQLYEKRLVFTKKELDAVDWIVEYNP